MKRYRAHSTSPKKFESSPPHHDSGALVGVESGESPESAGRNLADTLLPAAEARSKYDSSKPLAQRLREGTRRSDGCLLWTGTHDEDGYGRLQYRRRKWRVHRLAWTLHHGPIPRGLVVMHLCDTPACCNIDHLQLGTQHENLRDRDRKRRTVVPVRARNAWTGEHRRVS